MSTSTDQRYPLHWPAHIPRTPVHQRKQSQFGRPSRREADYGRTQPGGGHAYRYIPARNYSMEEASDTLTAELRKLGASAVVLSTNVELRLDGLPYSGRKAPADCGAVCYFTLRGRKVAMPCDRWNRVEDNVYAIAKHIEAMRGQERWGVGTSDQAFGGYAAIPAQCGTSGEGWWDVLKVPAHTPTEAVQAAWRARVQETHPDKPGGSASEFERVMKAWNSFKEERGL